MARISDIIEEFIKSLLEKNNQKELQIQRNELANNFNCSPSQINYVLTTRFTYDKGYHIESRRGGGGYIIIRKIEFGSFKSLAERINEVIDNNITYGRAVQVINGLIESGTISLREGNLMKVAINDRLIYDFENRNRIRAEILKAMVGVVLA